MASITSSFALRTFLFSMFLPDILSFVLHGCCHTFLFGKEFVTVLAVSLQRKHDSPLVKSSLQVRSGGRGALAFNPHHCTKVKPWCCCTPIVSALLQGACQSVLHRYIEG